jgi:hypothetical protein
VKSYNPLKSPNRSEWLALSETERIELIHDHHTEQGERVDRLTAHCGIHATIETQMALDTPQVRATLGRLRKQGLNRHDAIHAIGFVLAEHMQNLIASTPEGLDPNEDYYEKLSKFNAPDWLETAGDV